MPSSRPNSPTTCALSRQKSRWGALLGVRDIRWVSNGTDARFQEG